MLRARLIDCRFPPKFWSVLIHCCAWTWNHLVRSNGSAPIEVFEKPPIDFTNIQIPGVLVYWHLNKRNCADKKLGPTCGVGVYIGPADAVRQSGHQVYSVDCCVLSTPYVIPDLSVMPFDQGLQQILAQLSTLSVDALPADIDPSEFVINNEVDSYSLIGAEVYKEFDYKWYSCSVLHVHCDPNHSKVLLFKIVYKDNDSEATTYDELKKILVNHAHSAASFASIDPALQSLLTA